MLAPAEPKKSTSRKATTGPAAVSVKVPSDRRDSRACSRVSPCRCSPPGPPRSAEVGQIGGVAAVGSRVVDGVELEKPRHPQGGARRRDGQVARAAPPRPRRTRPGWRAGPAAPAGRAGPLSGAAAALGCATVRPSAEAPPPRRALGRARPCRPGRRAPGACRRRGPLAGATPPRPATRQHQPRGQQAGARSSRRAHQLSTRAMGDQRARSRRQSSRRSRTSA